MDCQAVAKGPVSASPSPIIQATMSPGLSNAAPKAWLSEYPSLAALVNGTRRRRGDMARNAARKRELLEQPLHPALVLADVGIDLAIAALEIGIGDQGRPAVTGTGDVDHVEIMQSDRPVQMDVDEILSGRRSPMPDHERLDMRQREGFAQHRICVEVDLTNREVVGGAPIRVELLQFV